MPADHPVPAPVASPSEGTTPAAHCECGHVHATAEQDGVVSVFHRCRAKGCDCREFVSDSLSARLAEQERLTAMYRELAERASASRGETPPEPASGEQPSAPLDLKEMIGMYGAACRAAGIRQATDLRYQSAEVTERRTAILAALAAAEAAREAAVRDAQAADELRKLTEEDRDRWRTLVDPSVRPLDDWHEDYGPALWWVFHPHTGEVYEPPYSGTPLDDDWPGYHTHWTRIVPPSRRATPRASQPTDKCTVCGGVYGTTPRCPGCLND